MIFVLSITHVSAGVNETSTGDGEEVVIDAPQTQLYYKNGTRLNIGLYDSNNTPIANQNLSVNINNINYNKTTSFNGKTSISLNLAPGDYPVIIFFNGSGKYLSSNTTTFVKILPTVSAADLTKYYRNSTQYCSTFLYGNGSVMSNHNVSFNVNGEFYQKTTDENGVCLFNIDFEPGTYTITAINPADNCTVSNTVVVLGTISAGNISKYYKNSTQFSAKFLDGSGNILSNRRVSFTVNNNTYTKTTNDEGIARLAINLYPGVYDIFSFNPSDNYTCKNTVIVLSTVTGSDIKKYFKNQTGYSATFLDGSGKKLVNAAVVFNINGVLYKKTTNTNGTAHLNINLASGNYTITAINPYDNLTWSNTVTVLSTVNGINLFKIYRDDNQYWARFLTPQGKSLSGVAVNYNINGVFYQKTTNSNGVAVLNINLGSGDYILTATNPINGEMQSNTVKVYEYSATSLDVNSTVFRPNDEKVLYVYLKNQLGYGVKDQTIISSVSNTTSNNGLAVFNLDLASGNHTLTFKYNGNGVYASSTKTIHVEIIKGIQISVVDNNKIIQKGQSFELEFKPAVNLTSDITVNGITYTRSLNSQGIARLKINLNPGYYNVGYLFNHTGYELIKKTTRILVVSSTDTLLQASDDTLREFSNTPYTVKLTAGGIGVAGEKIIININGVNYTKTTNSEGIATINLNIAKGIYTVKYYYHGDVLKDSSGSSVLTVKEYSINGFGYWVRYNHMTSLDLAGLAFQGTKQIFLHSYAFTAYGEMSVLSWIKKANSYGINVHIWMQVFYDGGSWIRPVNDDGSFKYSYFNTKINQAKYYAGLNGVAGVHMDYLRFGGTAYKYSTSVAAINYFTEKCSSELHALNPNIIVSAAVMPEPSGMTYYYGQDIPTMSKYLDVIIPMIYKGNYNKDTTWIRQTTQWFVDNSNGAQIWSGLQAYASDSNVAKLSVAELTGDAQACLDGGASGVVMFRWGVCNFINFKGLKY